jgi:hypothetical protein
MVPTVGRIVLVRSPAFLGECPAIVTAVYDGGVSINCRVFTNEPGDNYIPLIMGLGPQELSSVKWGWRWPPRDDITTPEKIRAFKEALARSVFDLTPDTPAGEPDASGIPGVEPQ